MTVGYDPFDRDIPASRQNLAVLFRARELSGNREEVIHDFLTSRIIVNRVYATLNPSRSMFRWDTLPG
jgi:hypothetical protein